MLVYHGRTHGGRRRHTDLRSYEAWSVDCDAAGAARPTAFLEALEEADIAYVYQERLDGRRLKYHLVIPLAEPHSWPDAQASSAGVRQWRGRMTAMRRWLDRVTGNAHDKAFDNIGQGLKPYTRRPEDRGVRVLHRHYLGENALDAARLLDDLGYAPAETTGRVRRREVDTGAAKAFGHLIVSEAPSHLGGWYIRCPADHEQDHRSKTWLRPDGTVMCMAAKCRGRPQSYFRDLLVGEAAAVLTDDRLEKARAVVKVRGVPVKIPLSEAASAIGDALARVDPLENTGHVLRITPGAGKTYAAVRFLERYCAPEGEGEVGGRTAVIAFPTNALLREVARGVTVPHRVRTGVLGVVNDDGVYACMKWRAAKEVQDSGGNVHKVLCARCEFRDGCAARAESTRGEGSLVLTNHALLPSVVKDLRGRGRVPMVVWDESPAMVDAVVLTWAELRAYREALLFGLRPLADALDALERFPVYGEIESSARLLTADVLLSARPGDASGISAVDLSSVVERWGRTRAAVARVRSLRARLGASVEGRERGLSLGEVCSTVEAAVAGDRGEDRTSFDQLGAEERKRHAACWRVSRLLDAAFSEGASLRVGPSGVEVTCLTENGREFRRWGGVVLDATASRGLLTAVRAGPISVVDLDVKDASDVAVKGSRVWAYREGLSRTAFKDRPDDAGAVLERSVEWLVKQGVGTRGKAVVFVYKDLLSHPALAPLRENSNVYLSYFGNVRGYNNFFRDGYVDYVTVGDPVSNLGAVDSAARYLSADTEVLVGESVVGELCQAHGRARDVREWDKVGEGTENGPGFLAWKCRRHWHVGVHLPTGWDEETVTCVTF